jgi:hypothetical protein
MQYSEKERTEWLQKVRPGFLKWSFEDRSNHSKELYEKLKNTIDKSSGKTLLQLGLDKRSNTINEKNGNPVKSEYVKYLLDIRRRTEKNDLSVLSNFEKRGRCDLVEDAYHLDHKVSIFEGFAYNVPPEIISSIYNLEFLPHSVNCQKNKTSSMTIEKLTNLYETQCRQ